jgi:hypothetical protein
MPTENATGKGTWRQEDPPDMPPECEVTSGLTPAEIDLMWKTALPRMPIPPPNI